jgi:hypothetical protein
MQVVFALWYGVATGHGASAVDTAQTLLNLTLQVISGQMTPSAFHSYNVSLPTCAQSQGGFQFRAVTNKAFRSLVGPARPRFKRCAGASKASSTAKESSSVDIGVNLATDEGDLGSGEASDRGRLSRERKRRRLG